MKYVKLVTVTLVQNQQIHQLPSGVIPDQAKVISIKTRKTGVSSGYKRIENGAGFDGLVLELKSNGTDVQYQIPLSSIAARSTQGDCMGYVFTEPTRFMFGEVGSVLKSYDAANVTTNNVVELEIFYEH